jgi:hypothetical protein
VGGLSGIWEERLLGKIMIEGGNYHRGDNNDRDIPRGESLSAGREGGIFGGNSPLFIRPDGRGAPVEHIIRHNQQLGEPEIPTSVLHAGDTISMQSQSGELTFHVEAEEWDGLGPGETPTKRISGTIHGTALSDEENGKEVDFVGSGFGGSAVQSSILGAAYAPYFADEEGNEIHGPVISNFYVSRINEAGALASVDFNRPDSREENNPPEHARRLAEVTEIARASGLSLQEIDMEGDIWAMMGQQSSIGDDFVVYTRKGVATGNEIAAYDLENNQWMHVNYSNYRGEDMLKISIADIDEEQSRYTRFAKVFRHSSICAPDALYRAKIGMTAYTSSRRFGLDAVAYIPSGDEAKTLLDVPSDGKDVVYVPPIYLWPNGQMQLGRETMFEVMAEDRPGIKDRVKSKIGYEIDTDGTKSLTLGEKRITIPTPDAMLAKMRAKIEEERRG